MRDAEADRPRGARGAVGGEGARFDPCGFGRINHSAAFCAIQGGRSEGRRGFAVTAGRWIDQAVLGGGGTGGEAEYPALFPGFGVYFLLGLTAKESTVLFKTRVGLCVLSENIEIHAFRPKDAKTWSIAAQRRSESEMEGKTLFGRKVKFSGPWFYLAAFKNHTGVEQEIGKTMQLIVDAFANSAPICDLSQVGSAEAWHEKSKFWEVVNWP